MGIKFNRYIINCMNERTDEIVNDVAANNKAFRRMTDKIILIMNAIDEIIPPECKKLFEELDDIQGKRDVIMHEKLYWQALKDGIKISNVFHSIK